MRRFLLSTVFAAMTALVSNAQMDTIFWFAAPDISAGSGNVEDCSADNKRYLLVSTGNSTAEITISQPANTTFVPVEVLLNAGESQLIDLSSYPCNQQFPDGINSIENNPADNVNNLGILVHATDPVSVNYLANTGANTGIWSLKGSYALGKEFIIPMQNTYSNMAGIDPLPYNQIHVVSAEANNSVTITPSVDIAGHEAGVPFTITLEKGQSYNLQALDADSNNVLDGQEHLTGTLITSTKSMAVSMGDDLMEKTNPVTCSDMNGDQLVPADMLGMDYIALKSPQAPGDHVYIVATRDNSTIWINDTIRDTLDRTESISYTLVDDATAISSNNPVYVYHLSGIGCEAGGALLPPVTCRGANQTSFSRPNEKMINLNLLTKAGGENSFQLKWGDHAMQIPPAWFKPFYDNDSNLWMYLDRAYADMSDTLPVNENIQITNTKEKFQAGILFGEDGHSASYAYMAGFEKYTGNAGIKAKDMMDNCVKPSLQLLASGGDSYQWSLQPGGETYLTDSLVADPLANPPTGEHVYSVDISGDCITDTSIDIAIKVAKNIDADFELLTNEICSPGSAEILYTSLIDSAHVKSFKWDFGDGTTDTVKIDSFSYNYNNNSATEKIYTLKLMVEDSTGCIDTREEIIRVYPETDAVFTAVPTSGCSPVAVDFNNISNGHGTRFTWYIEGEKFSEEYQLGSLEFSNYTDNDSSHTISLTSDYKGFCKKTYARDINLLASVVSKFTMSDTLAPYNYTISLHNTSTGNIDTVFWDFGEGIVYDAISNEEFRYVAYKNPTNALLRTTISQTVQSVSGCSSVKYQRIYFYPENVVAEMELDTSELCSPVELEIHDISSLAITRILDYGNGKIDTFYNPFNKITDTILTVTLENNTKKAIQDTIRLTVVDAFGNTDETFQVVNIYPYVHATFDVPDTMGCHPYNFVVDASKASTGFDYQWTLNDSTFSSTSDNINLVLNNTSQRVRYYDLKLVTEAPNCMDDTTRTIHVFQSPKADLEALYKQLTYPDTIFIFENLSSSGLWNNIWEFHQNNGVLVDNSPVVTYRYSADTTTTFYPMLTVENPFLEKCTDSKSIEVTLVIPETGINDVYSADQLVSVFPNPFSLDAQVTINNPEVKINAVSLVDLSGKVVQSKDMKNVSSFRISRDGLPEGIYFLQLDTEHKTYVKKLVIQ